MSDLVMSHPGRGMLKSPVHMARKMYARQQHITEVLPLAW